jgi:hypothetical protein
MSTTTDILLTNNISINKRRHTMTADIDITSIFTLKSKGSTVSTYFHIPGNWRHHIQHSALYMNRVRQKYPDLGS